MSYFLTNKNTRVFNVDLAKAIGLNEAIVLQQIQYWIEIKESDVSKYKDSFHDGYLWVYNSIPNWQEQLPFWSYDTVKRTLKSLENQELVFVGVFNKVKYDKTKWYRINYAKVEEKVAQTHENNDECKLPLSTSAELHDGKMQDALTNTKEYTDTSTNTSIECIKWYQTEKSFDTATFLSYEILEKQIVKCLNELGYSETEDKETVKKVIHIVEYYYDAYENTFGATHPVISNKAMSGMLDRLISGSEKTSDYRLDTEVYETLIDKHFRTQYKNCDYNICHFMTEEIRNNRFYETLY